MKKTFLIIVLVIITFFSINVNAENIDTTRTSTVNIKYSYGDTNFNNKKAYLYKIADINAEGELIYTEKFTDLELNLDNLTSSELNALTVKISNQIEQQDIPHTHEQVTNAEGLAEFNSLQTGIYLLKIDTVTNKDYQYKAIPMLISIPLYDEVNKQYKYDLSIIAKTEAKYIGEQVNDGNTTNPPNTVDSIMIYAAVFIISILCIIGLVCYIKKINKEGSNKNEKIKK